MKRKRTVLIAVLALVSVILVAVPLFTVQADYGTNWTGTFFPSNNLTGTGVSIGNIQGLNFNWGSGAPIVNGQAVPGMPSDNFSARFTSTQNLTPGQYTFVISSDDGVRLYINGALVLDKFIGRTLATDNVVVSIATSPVNLTVEYFEGIDQAVLQVQWFRGAINSTATPLPTATQSAPIRNYFDVHSVPLSWNSISWAIGYRVQVAYNKLFTNVVWDDDTLPANSLSVTTPYLNNGFYYWRIRAKVTATTWGGWSAGDTFTVATPDLGTNWTGTFFPSDNLTGTGVPIGNIQGLNFNWGTGTPVINGVAVPGIPADNFSARFTSTQYLSPGQYSFVVSSDDGVRLYVNGALVLDKFVGRLLTTDVVPVTITTSPVNLTVEYFEGVDQAILQVEWFKS